ncbi:Chloroperoxidase [Mycena olivaceomarginata]|nr:Chloroperoxidase [Mycena olivaceomarginata]
MRGPAMNTLANHGYISRNGITSFEEIILGTEEAFNLNRDMASAMAANNMLTRGNPFVNKISIGGVSSFVPPLPGQIDGPETQGIAKHGRVEGDASMTRSDVHIGDNRNFNQTLWDMDLEQLAKFGDDGPDGPATVFNVQTLIELVRQNLESDQALDPEFAIPIRRLNIVFDSNGTDTDSVASVFANGTTNQATKRIITSFFMNQTFPENWFRAAAPVLGSPIPGQIAAALPQWVPGHNDENAAGAVQHQFGMLSWGCANYWDDLVNAVPGTLADVTGIFKQNVDMLTGILFSGSGCSEPIAPAGPTNV